MALQLKPTLPFGLIPPIRKVTNTIGALQNRTGALSCLAYSILSFAEIGTSEFLRRTTAKTRRIFIVPMAEPQIILRGLLTGSLTACRYLRAVVPNLQATPATRLEPRAGLKIFS